MRNVEKFVAVKNNHMDKFTKSGVMDWTKSLQKGV